MKIPGTGSASRQAATIRDVAKDLDISVATVSRALSKPQMLRPATVERVREAVERLGYAPI
jgi:DNA-binding LacI/PurR family transcriptional regulator